MCVIAISEMLSKRATLADLKKMESANPDGAGVAWVHRGQVHWRKGLSAEQVHEEAGKHEGPVIYHFRIATVGGVRKALCHPFPVERASRLDIVGRSNGVIFHNGNWSEWKEAMLRTVQGSGIKIPGGEWSDSRAMAILAAVHGKEVLRFIGGWNKVVHLGGDGAVTTFGDFEKYKDLIVSNNFFANRATSYAGGYIVTSPAQREYQHGGREVEPPKRGHTRGLPLGPVERDTVANLTDAEMQAVMSAQDDEGFLDKEYAAFVKANPDFLGSD